MFDTFQNWAQHIKLQNQTEVSGQLHAPPSLPLVRTGFFDGLQSQSGPDVKDKVHKTDWSIPIIVWSYVNSYHRRFQNELSEPSADQTMSQLL